MYCKKCGGKLESYANNCAFCGHPVEKYETTARYVKEETDNGEIKHMTVLQWIGLPLLNFIPLVGTIIYLVLLFKWAFGKTNNLTLKNYAKASLIFMIISIVLVIIYSIFIMSNIELLNELLEGMKL